MVWHSDILTFSAAHALVSGPAMPWLGGVGSLNARVPSRFPLAHLGITLPESKHSACHPTLAGEQDRVGAPGASGAVRWAPFYGTPKLPQRLVVECTPPSSTAPVTSPKRNDETFLRGAWALASPLSHSGYVKVGASINGKERRPQKKAKQERRTQRDRDQKIPKKIDDQETS